MKRCSVPLAVIVLATIAFTTPIFTQQPDGKKPAAGPVAVPTTPRELLTLIRKLDEAGRGDDSDAGSSGIGALLSALMQVKDPKLARVLTFSLATSTSWKVKAGCVTALSNIDTPESTEALVRLLKSTPARTAENEAALKQTGMRTQTDFWMYGQSLTTAAKCVVQRGSIRSVIEDLKRFNLVEELAAGGKPGLEAIMEWSREVKSGKSKDLLPSGATVAVEAIRSPDCLELLREAALDEGLEDDVRQAALRALAEGWGAGEYETIIKAARTARSTGVCSQAYAAAVAADPKRAAGDLMPLLKSPHYPLRGQAAYLLGTIGDPKVIPDLVELLDDEQDFVRLEALCGLWLLDHTKRTVKWNDPKFEKKYQQWMDSHPKDK